jgi:hypothetical protein
VTTPSRHSYSQGAYSTGVTVPNSTTSSCHTSKIKNRLAITHPPVF